MNAEFSLFFLRHVSHVGWNDDIKGWDIEQVDPDLKVFLEKVGVSEHQFRNQDTRDFIYDFIEKNGGMNAIKEDIFSSVSKTTVQQLQSQQQSPAAPQRQEYPPPVPARTIPVCIHFLVFNVATVLYKKKRRVAAMVLTD